MQLPEFTYLLLKNIDPWVKILDDYGYDQIIEFEDAYIHKFIWESKLDPDQMDVIDNELNKGFEFINMQLTPSLNLEQVAKKYTQERSEGDTPRWILELLRMMTDRQLSELSILLQYS